MGLDKVCYGEFQPEPAKTALSGAPGFHPIARKPRVMGAPGRSKAGPPADESVMN